MAVKKWAYSGKIKYIRTPGGKLKVRSEGFLAGRCRGAGLMFMRGLAQLTGGRILRGKSRGSLNMLGAGDIRT